MSTEVIGDRALNRALLARQLLLERSPLAPLAAVEQLVGLQAQAPQAPYVGLWSRLRDSDPVAVSEALERRELVRIAVMRGTLHLVTDADAPWLRALVQPALERELTGRRGQALAGHDREAIAAAARAALEDDPQTLAALAAGLVERFGADADALASVARTSLALVQVPPRGLWRRGGAARHTTTEAWLGASVPTPDDGDRERLLLRYLTAFGPASVADAQAWAGVTRLGAVAERLGDRLVTLRTEDGRELLDLPDAPRPDPDTPAPVRLLPEYDNVLLSHADRGRIIDADHRSAVFTRGAVLVDGRVAGAWSVRRVRGDIAAVMVEPLRQLTRAERADVAAEARALLVFLAGGEDAPGDLVWVRGHVAG